ncbi:response regulator receiver and ANTAR domain protein [Desulfofarcimen acetoxidans DSM 771]|jgi:response regulator NasT|uniref:Stage 0 sporulation protein A homolog n=1 Tax=Desulfofarcimen acetoxidans (strain ATCC 49208 / DSM 771 / KCTC 5769 / VKM B-1644 / 5575) TaxID=485916 RepID=C8VX75_DESAS|nr:response regulator [Desulfofarcimen acetoxidans]ACV64471.1 response regulator receiver and ANTAR domain protein [Desulfofarcimen acetoxidans DSM 771]
MYGTRIVIADADRVFLKKLKDSLTHVGYMVVGEVYDAKSALQVIFKTEPDLIIMDSNIPGCEGLEIARVIEEHRVAPVLLLTAYSQRELIEEAKHSWVFGYLLKPINQENLFPAIEIAIASFKRLLRLENENKELKKLLEEGKLIEKAKGLLISQKGLSEKEAHKFIQKISMDKGIAIPKVAKKIISLLQKENN